MNTNEMYDHLASVYHLIFADWEDSIREGAEDLDGIIRKHCPAAESVLDVSCGIGTQVLGLARLGYKVTGSDLSEGAVRRARDEADRRDLDISLSVADMRQAWRHHQCQFDAVISYHNCVTHLETDDDILTAFNEFRSCLRDGGICLINVRDYDNEERGTGLIKPFVVSQVDGRKCVVFQVWDFEGRVCRVSLYFVWDDGEAGCQTDVFRTVYFATGIGRLMELMGEAGFASVERLDDHFSGSVILGRK